MKKHRRKIALALALALLFGSAAASAANYSAGRGALPSFAGASDALSLASSGASSAVSWLITRARSSTGSAFAYLPTPPARPAEVATPPAELPMYARGPVTPIDLDPHWPGSVPRVTGEPERVHAPSFDDGIAATRMPGSVMVAGIDLPSLPGTGGGGTLASPSVTTPATPSTPSTPSTPGTPGTPPTVDIPVTPGTPPITTPITSPVPELPPYAMLVAGMGLLAAMRRRKA